MGDAPACLSAPLRSGGALRCRWFAGWLALGAAVLLSACAGVPRPVAPQATASDLRASVPERWQAPPAAGQAPAASQALPHGGSLEALLGWWRQQGDPVLVELIAASQQVSPTVAAAASRLAQARALSVAAGADMAPSLDAAGSLTRSRSLQASGQPAVAATAGQLGLQTSWEIDLFGGLRAEREAAGERLRGAQADWHEARVSVAAEVAVQYDRLRQCRRLADIFAREAASRTETARLTERTRQAGLAAPAQAALAQAAAAQTQARARQQADQCELELQALVVLTALPEPELRSRLAALVLEPGLTLPPLALDPVPARALAQRPDVFSAERAVRAAWADVAGAQAQRLPRVALNGFIGVASLRAGAAATEAATWSLGPLSLSLPLADGGRRQAQVDAAQARYEEALARHAAQVRQAASEVESALLRLHGSAARGPQVAAAVTGYRSALQAVQAREQAGLASLLELEDARRQQLAAEIALADWQTEVRAAHVLLYRAVGGGWSPALLDPAEAVAGQPR